MQHNKKLLAAAVAGAFAVAPAMVAAQTSTIQIGGSASLLYYIQDGANGVSSTGKKGDHIEGSEPELYVRGTENLGGGLSLWFQCASSMDYIGTTGVGLCTRNSAVGFRGNWGNVFAGNWDTPLKLTYGQTRGWFSGTNGLYGGSGNLLFGGTGAGPNPPSGATTTTQNGSFFRRHGNLISYHSPAWNGFNAKAAYSASNEATGLGVSPLKPRLYSLTGEYVNGPLFVNVGYEQHQDYNPGVQGAASYAGGDDTKWMIGAGYTFANNFRLSALWTESEYDVTNTTSMDVSGWAIYADWKVQGPHSVRAQYATVGDTKGNSTSSVGRYAAATNALDTGADMWTLAYAYEFSKRTSVGLAYNRLSNDAGAAFNQGKVTSTVGGNQSNYGMFVNHRF